MIDACLNSDPTRRPNISQIVHDLQESCADEISLGSYGRWVVGGSDLSATSSPALVEEKARNSAVIRMSHLSVTSRLSTGFTLVYDGMDAFRSSSTKSEQTRKSMIKNYSNKVSQNISPFIEHDIPVNVNDDVLPHGNKPTEEPLTDNTENGVGSDV
jgi:hypothetical protein